MRDPNNHLRLVPSEGSTQSSVKDDLAPATCVSFLDFRWTIAEDLRTRFNREPSNNEYRGIDINLLDYSEAELRVALRTEPPKDAAMCASAFDHLTKMFMEAYRHQQ